MTTLLLIRHGIAEDPRSGQQDADRALTEEGWVRTRAAMKGLVAVYGLKWTGEAKRQGQGELNPHHLEWMMGYPIGWTEIEH